MAANKKPVIQTAWVPTAVPAHVTQAPKRGKKATEPVQKANHAVDEVELCDDPIPANRITSVQSKYMPLFEAIRANHKKGIKCHPGAVGSIASGLRKYLERRGEKRQIRNQVGK